MMSAGSEMQILLIIRFVSGGVVRALENFDVLLSYLYTSDMHYDILRDVILLFRLKCPLPSGHIVATAQ